GDAGRKSAACDSRDVIQARKARWHRVFDDRIGPSTGSCEAGVRNPRVEPSEAERSLSRQLAARPDHLPGAIAPFKRAELLGCSKNLGVRSKLDLCTSYG